MHPQWVVAEWERYDNLKDRLEERNETIQKIENTKEIAAEQLAGLGPHTKSFYMNMGYKEVFKQMSALVPYGEINNVDEDDLDEEWGRGMHCIFEVIKGNTTHSDTDASLSASDTNSDVTGNRQYIDETHADLARAGEEVEDRAQAALMTRDLMEIEDGENAAEYVYRQYEVDPREYHTDYDLREEISDMDQRNRTHEERRF